MNFKQNATILLAVVLLATAGVRANINEDLRQAVQQGDLAKVNLLLDQAKKEKGISPRDLESLREKANLYIRRVFVQAAQEGNLAKVKSFVEFLETSKADVNSAVDSARTKHTALMRAAENGNLEIVKYLIEHRANVNLHNWARETALMFAARNGHLDVVKYLIEVGKADKDVVSQFGRTALAEAQKYNDIVTYLKQQGAK